MTRSFDRQGQEVHRGTYWDNQPAPVTEHELNEYARRLAPEFHVSLQRLAPGFCCDAVQEPSPWKDVPENHRVLMVGIVRNVLSRLAIGVKR